jgi:adenine phosphoribosyltransferase
MLNALIRDIPDFPKPGIMFRDITPLLGSDKFVFAIENLIDNIPTESRRKVNIIAAPESRGFIIGATIATILRIGFVPMRKPGKLPYQTIKSSYNLEYGSDEIHMHIDAIKPGDNVLLADDLLATGGTIVACKELIEKAGGNLLGVAVLIELEELKGREKLNCPVISLLRY